MKNTPKYNPDLIGSRIKESRKNKKLTQDDLAEKLHTTKATISRYENGKVDKIRVPILESIAEILEVDVLWLLGAAEEESPFSAQTLDTYEYDYIPQGIAAGSPIEVDGLTEFEKISIPDVFLGKYAKNKNLKISRVNGESMNKIIPSGSLIGFLTDYSIDRLHDGDIVVFRDRYEYSLKHFYRTEENLIFRPDSTDPEYTDLIYSIEEAKEISIVGKLVIYDIVLD